MRILITGGAGMLGRDVRLAAERLGHEALALSHAELDVCDAASIKHAVVQARPQAVINCAAWTNVDGAETDYETALAINGKGAGQVAAAAGAAGAWTVQVSTDYVFDGTKREPYLESDAVAPMSGYGRSKLAGERETAERAPGAHTIVRTAWLFGSSGHCFPRTMLKLASERDQLRVVDDQVGCPTFTGHLGPALVELATRREPPLGVLHVTASGQCSWFEFASEVIGRAGLSCQVSPVTTAEFPRPAPRPAYSVLRSERRAPELPDWSEGLDAFLATAEVPA
jgi:dTDP-4-dehydrorhamnose reductase